MTQRFDAFEQALFSIVGHHHRHDPHSRTTLSFRYRLPAMVIRMREMERKIIASANVRAQYRAAPSDEGAVIFTP